MKILMLAAASSIHTIRWANAFAERGHEVHLVSQHKAGGGSSAQIRHELLPHLRGMGYLLNSKRVKELVDRIRPDVVNAHYATGYGTLARSVTQVPVVLNVWGSDVFEFPLKSRWHQRLLVRNLQHARALVSTSHFMADRTMELTQGRQRVEVVPFGVDTNRFAAFDREPSASLTIGTVKTLAPVYGIDILLNAFAIVRKDPAAATARLIIAGSGPEAGRLRDLAVRLGIHDHVEFIGHVPHDRVPQVLRQFDVFAALSRMESFGVAVVEASSCGLPVVVSDAGGLSEVVVDGLTGIVVRRNDPAHAAQAIRRLVEDHELRRQMGQRGRDHVVHEYEWSQCVAEMLRILEGVIAKASA
jgi:L-malate glycosyltransferase